MDHAHVCPVRACGAVDVDEKNVAFSEWFAKLLPSDSTEAKPPNQVVIKTTPGMGRGVFARTDLKEVRKLLWLARAYTVIVLS